MLRIRLKYISPKIEQEAALIPARVGPHLSDWLHTGVVKVAEILAWMLAGGLGSGPWAIFFVFNFLRFANYLVLGVG